MARTQNNPPGSLLRWAAVIAGTVIGVALIALLSSLFVAIGNEIDAVARNLHWFAFGSAIVSLFVAGLLAGGLSRMRGIGSGLLHGLTAWGLILVVALAFPFPQGFGLIQVFTTPVPELAAGPLWAGFLTLAIGAITAALGGLLGGMFTRGEEPGYAAGEELAAGRDYEAGREFEAGRAYEARRYETAHATDGGRDGGRGGPNGGRRYEPAGDSGRTERQPAPTEQQPTVAAGDEAPRGRRRR